MNSPLLSDQNTLILCFDRVSMKAFNSLNFSKHSPFVLNIYTHTFLRKLLIKVTKFFELPMDEVLIGPHMFQCINSKGVVVPLPGRWETPPYVINPQCTLHKPTKIWDECFYQGSCHLPCFEVHEHSSELAVPSSSAPSFVDDCTMLAAYVLCILVQVALTWHYCNKFAISTSQCTHLT